MQFCSDKRFEISCLKLNPSNTFVCTVSEVLLVRAFGEECSPHFSENDADGSIVVTISMVTPYANGN